MAAPIVFAGPDGDYVVTLPDVASLEDAMLSVAGPDVKQVWAIETDEHDTDGVRQLSGLARGRNVLWFVLRLSEPAEISYWSNRELVRTDKSR